MLHEKPLCDICHQNVASVYISRIAFGKTTKQRLCEACAREDSAGQEWFASQDQDDETPADDSPESQEFNEAMKGLFDHLEKTGGEINLDEISVDSIEQVFASSLDLPAEELDEFLSEMESMLDEAMNGEPVDDESLNGDGAAEQGNGEQEPLPEIIFPPQGVLPKGESAAGPRGVLSARCPKCGTTWDRLREDGRAGCARCYEAFEEKLLDVMNRMQRDVHHVGKSPRAALKRRRRLEHLRAKRDHRLEMLQRRLQEAITAEQYEDAAALRDKIKMVSSTIVSDE